MYIENLKEFDDKELLEYINFLTRELSHRRQLETNRRLFKRK